MEKNNNFLSFFLVIFALLFVVSCQSVKDQKDSAAASDRINKSQENANPLFDEL